MTGRSSDAAGEARLRRYLHQLDRTCQFKYQIQSPTVVDQAQHEQDPTAGDGQAYKEDKKQRSALWAWRGRVASQTTKGEGKRRQSSEGQALTAATRRARTWNTPRRAAQKAFSAPGTSTAQA
ncbi:unnamed protein product [Prorocentrum cordatum]|uniref:Uncharacterized protein n=1 Tax=Prorocentrum cordatum TaxID=2364126 RepID=A0ABN9TIM1_9DINO|nr:unnamed protein product [Polarella glacialis]